MSAKPIIPIDSATLDRLKGWPKPQPLEGALPEVEQFAPDALLPASFRGWVVDVAERMQVPIDLPAIASVLCLAGAVNRRARIQPKASDTSWLVVPNLWGALIAPPGYLKTPVISNCIAPLERIEKEWRKQDEDAQAEYERLSEEHSIKHSAWKEQYKASQKPKGGPTPQRPTDAPVEPRQRRLIVNDPTSEALHEIMSRNPAGLLLIRDELTGWLSQLERTGREGDRSFALQAWNGDVGHTIDRIGRGSVHVPNCCMSLLGGIQPARLKAHIADAISGGQGDDGLLQRFQLMVWPDTKTAYRYVDRKPDQRIAEQASLIFAKLTTLDAENPLYYRFSDSAQAFFAGWLTGLEEKVRGDQLPTALNSHLSKYRKLMPAIALLLEISEWATGTGVGSAHTVSEESALRAALWCDYLESHARRIYSCIVSSKMQAARDLAERIKSGKVGADGVFSIRDVYRNEWARLSSPELVKDAAEILEDAGWIRGLTQEIRPSGGRPQERFEINPEVRKRSIDEAQ